MLLLLVKTLLVRILAFLCLLALGIVLSKILRPPKVSIYIPTESGVSCPVVKQKDGSFSSTCKHKPWE